METLKPLILYRGERDLYKIMIMIKMPDEGDGTYDQFKDMYLMFGAEFREGYERDLNW